MNAKSISENMERDHGKIVKLLIDFEKSIDQDKKTMLKSFNCFFWELEKHFFTEEKVIFIKYNPKEGTEGYEFVSSLMSQHDEIFDQIKTIRKNINKNKDFDFKSFKELLKTHKDFEDEIVYPIIDKELDESNKKLIINRINEIKLTD